MKPRFLNEDGIMMMHRELIRKFGGSEGVRDRNMLLSAIEMPKASFGGEFLHEDLFAMASAYLFHLVQNHPFVDGNKRIGATAAAVFLDANGFELIADEVEYGDLVLEVAQGRMEKAAIAEFLRRNSLAR